MSRRRNVNETGQAHELTFSCYQGYPFLSKDRTRLWLVEAINEARVRFDFALWAYVFMPEHAHILIWPRQADYDIAEIRAAIKEPVGRKAIKFLTEHAREWLPRLRRVRGNRIEYLFWQSGGGYDRNAYRGRTLRQMIEYINANPVRRGLVVSPLDWLWSSSRQHAGLEPGPLVMDDVDL